MRIKNILITTFLVVAVLPPAIFAMWAYNYTVERQLYSVNDRHLLLANNMGHALKRYHDDLVGTIDSIAVPLIQGKSVVGLEKLMMRLSLECVWVADIHTGKIESITKVPGSPDVKQVNGAVLNKLLKVAQQPSINNQLKFSPVMGLPNGKNVIFAAKRVADKLVAGKITTDYFTDLGSQISFGKKGHAAIVDHEGNVLYHPNPVWRQARKNLSKVSAVRRLMNGEAGVEEFYSPAVKADMIAGLKPIDGPGWGVMVPQPISELYNEALATIKPGIAVFATIVATAVLLSWWVAASLSRPLEHLSRHMRSNARRRQLRKQILRPRSLPILEVREIEKSYDNLVEVIGRTNKKVEMIAFTDSITGLPNRVRFSEVARSTLEFCEKESIPGILLTFDLDEFKELNDLHGRDIGDRVLRQFGNNLVELINTHLKTFDHEPLMRQKLHVSRIGSDEFGVLVPGITDPNEITWLLDELLGRAPKISGIPSLNPLQVSIACVKFPQFGHDLDRLLQLASITMEHIKNDGKNHAVVYDTKFTHKSDSELRADFVQAIEQDQLFVEYQPKICANKNKIYGVEALVRWDHPEIGVISPAIWVNAITNSPLMSDLGNWVIRRTMADHKEWLEQGRSIKVAINIGSQHFIAADFLPRLQAAQEKFGIDPKNFEIEITEDTLFGHSKLAPKALQGLKKAGYTTSLDDFGKGYSNLARLAELPVDFIKIDRTLIVGAMSSSRLNSILQSAILMAESLGSHVVAEGIEDKHVAEFALAMGADVLQGYYFARPMGKEALMEWYENVDIATMMDLSGKLESAA